MRLFSSSLLVAGVALGMATTANAASYTVNFCPADATCPTGITEASLTFYERMDTVDVNDYFLDLMIAGSAAAPQFVDIVSFKIDAVGVPAGYEYLPSLVSSPAAVTWSTYFDNVSGNAGACTSNTGQQHAVCSNGDGPGASMQNVINLWRYDVNLAGSFKLTDGADVNLRASFLNSEIKVIKGKRGQPDTYEVVYKNAGILSPGGGKLDLCVEGDDCYVPDPCQTDCGENPVPEPTTLVLTGLGLLGASFIARRRR